MISVRSVVALCAWKEQLAGADSRTARPGGRPRRDIGPVALVGGRGVARRGLSSGRVELEPLERIPRADLSALDAGADDVARFLA